MKSARFEVYQDVGDYWRWRLIAANGVQIAQGEAHSRKADAWRAVQAVKKAIKPMVSPSSGAPTRRFFSPEKRKFIVVPPDFSVGV